MKSPSVLEEYRKYWRGIDLVILDIAMPVLDGIEAFIEMRKINPKIKALIISGHFIEERKQEILKLGMKDILQKPYRNFELLQLIINTLATDI